MEPLFYFNQDAWDQYSKAFAKGFSKVLPYAALLLEGFAYMNELNKTEGLDAETKTQLLQLFIGTSAAKYGISPDAEVVYPSK